LQAEPLQIQRLVPEAVPQAAAIASRAMQLLKVETVAA